jgi:hypothetical protein
LSIPRARILLLLLPTLLAAVRLAAQTCAGELRVIVLDSQHSPIFDAGVDVRSGTEVAGSRSTQTAGLVDFEKIPCGSWTVNVAKEGFEPATRLVNIAAGGHTTESVTLTPQTQHSKVDVTAAPPPLIEQSTAEANQLHPAEVKTLPTNPGTVNDTLPLLPGIIRTPDGELKIEGSGEERSAMIVNQTDITDPATGKFGQSIPIDSVENVTVLNTPFLAQYGRFTQSVVAVETRRGGEKWHAELNDPFPDPRVRSYHLVGFRNETPRFVFGGPVLRNRLYFTSALQYYIQKTPDRTLPYPHNESKQQWYNSFSQADFILTPKQIITATLHISPQHTNFVNPDFFHPEPVTPSYAQHNYVGTAVDHFGFLGGILDSSISLQRFDAVIGAQGDAAMIMTPTGNQGNFFGTQNRSARRTEWLETWSLRPLTLGGTHLVKLGDSLTTSGNQGRFDYRPVQIVDGAGNLEERVDFVNLPPFNRDDLEVTAYVQDHWSPTPKLAFDYGARVEHQRLASSLRIAPREGVSWSPFGNGRTVIRTGYGQFYDHLPPDIYTFGRYPLRIRTFFAPDGSMLDGPTPYVNVIGSVDGPRSFLVRGRQVAGAFSPRGATLNVQAEHSFSHLVRVRAVFTDNRSVGLVALSAEQLGNANEIVLNGDGKSRYRQAEFTARFTWKDSQQIIASYTRSRAEGTLNTFDQFLGNFPAPLVLRPVLYTNTPADLPNRFLLWGQVKTHFWQMVALPIIEYRNGLPYARYDATQNYVGTPYSDATRFPNFLSVDTRIYKDFKVNPKYTVRLSLSIFNITNHFNALAVHANDADPEYGIFFGNYKRRYRGDFDIIF